MKQIVIQDSNEQRPWRFPEVLRWFPDRSIRSHSIAIRVEKKRLEAGDYTLQKHQKLVGIERKSGMEELATNLFSDDYERAMPAFERFASAYKFPYLFIEGSLSSLYNKTPYLEDPIRVVDAISDLTSRLGIRMFLLGPVKTPKQKLRAGELALRVMLSHTRR